MNTDFDTVINRNNTYCTQWDYVQDRFGKAGLLPFTISDMDFSIPNEIQQALMKRLSHPVYGYSRWNHDDYKLAICQWFAQRFDSKINPDWIAYSPSVIYAISVLISQNTQPNDSVLLLTPAYDGFYGCIEQSQCHLQVSPLIEKNGHYSIDKADFEDKIALCKVLLLCNPHNPVGKVWSSSELKYILDECNKHDVFVISDDIHMDMCFSKPYFPITNFQTHNVAICTSASKSFNTPALGGAYTIIPEPQKHQRYLQALKQKDGLSSPSVFGMLATITAYNDCGYWIDELKAYLQENLNFVERYLKLHLTPLTMTQPEGLYFAWINYSELNLSAEELKTKMVENGVAIMTGDAYGPTAKHYLRLNIACPRSKIEDGLNRLKNAISGEYYNE